MKASSRNIIANRLKDHEFVNPVLEIMDYMENGKYQSNKDDAYLKMKIENIYKSLKKLK